MHTILFLAANPLGTDRLALDKEARAIQEELERCGNRDKFELVTRWAARPLDLLRELRKLKPTVVHFSGHGGRGALHPNAGPCRDIVGEFGTTDDAHQHGLYFQEADGRPQLVSTAALEETFGAAGASVKLVVLNACYSEVQAEALLAHVGCVVGMGGSIRDDAARNFAIGFYGGIGERESVAAAYKQGRAAMSLEGLRDSEKPQLKIRDGIDAGRLVLANPDLGKKIELPIRDMAPPPRGWTWCNSVESAGAGKVSVLAIVETIAASTIYAWIALRFGTLHLMISACIAPFLLLRTSHSTSLAWKWFDSFWKLISSHWHNGKYNTPFEFNGFTKTLFGGIINYCHFICLNLAPLIIIRVCAVVITSAIHPLGSISEVPRNWWRSVVCVDSCCPLEMLPDACSRYGPVMHDDSIEVSLLPWKAIRCYYQELTQVDVRTRLAFCIGLPVVAVTILLPATLYRWSLKGSALIYGPLLWIVHSATARTLRVHLQDILNLAYYRLTRWFAAFVLFLFLTKVYVYRAWVEFAQPWQAIPGHRLIDSVVMPDAFPPWQIASVVNAILVCILYFVADWALMRMKRGLRIHERAVEVLLRWLSLVRGVMSVYTIFCGIYLAASLSGRFDLPSMGTRFLPWQ